MTALISDRPSEKFSHPDITAKGETRAYVAYSGTQTLWFNTGTLCNIECANCYIESSPTNDRLVYLSLNDVTPFLDELDAAGETPIEIGLTGGEPFMAPEIISILDACLSRGHEVLLLTNAMQPMMRPRVMEGLLAIKETYGERLTLRISLDHYSRRYHDEERGAGSFDLTLKGMIWLAENGFQMAIAGRTMWHEPEDEAREGYRALVLEHDLKLDVDKGTIEVLSVGKFHVAICKKVTPFFRMLLRTGKF